MADVAGYLRQAGDNDRQFIEDLIEIDLECRWKQFDSESEPAAKVERVGLGRDYVLASRPGSERN